MCEREIIRELTIEERLKELELKYKSNVMLIKSLRDWVKLLENRLETMKNKVIIDLLERLLYEVQRDGCFEGTDYITYVEGVIEGLKEDNTMFAVPDTLIDLDDWVIYANTGEDLTENEAIKREVMRELYD